MKNKFISNCVFDLDVLANQPVVVECADKNGLKLAAELARESIRTRISILEEFLNEDESSNGICAEFIENVIEVLQNDINDASSDSFGESYKSTLDFYIKKLTKVLEKYS